MHLGSGVSVSGEDFSRLVRVVWAAMMTRKMMILIAAVLAPLAFSGATADITRSWVRRWIEFTAAMIVSKLLLVIILSVGVSILNGAGQDGNGPTQAFTQLAAGSLILLTGRLAPWIAIRMFHFAGDTLYSAPATVAQGSAGARSIVAAPQKVSSAQWQARSLASTLRGRPAWGGGPAGPGRAQVGQQTNVAGAPARQPQARQWPPTPRPPRKATPRLRPRLVRVLVFRPARAALFRAHPVPPGLVLAARFRAVPFRAVPFRAGPVQARLVRAAPLRVQSLQLWRTRQAWSPVNGPP